MTDANSQFFAILTNAGMAKQANADALGIPWRITDMGVGDANLTDPIPKPEQTKLINEWRRRPLNQLKVNPVDPAIIIAEQIIPADEGGRWIREIGLYDEAGDLVAVANCAPSYKPLLSQGSGRTQVVRMNFIVNNSGSVALKIDPAVVLATRTYVDAAIQEVLPADKTAGEYTRLKVNTRGVVISGDNPSTLEGMGITNSYTKTEVNELIDDVSQEVEELQVNGPVAGISRNAKMTISAASASANFTADEVVVKSAFGGRAFVLGAVASSINLASVGAGGMDNGLAPASGYVAVYEIYNPDTKIRAMLGVDATGVVAPDIYSGAYMPAGFTASGLVAVIATNASRQFVSCKVKGRRVTITAASPFGTSTTTTTPTMFSLAALVPKNAKRVAGSMAVQGSVGGAAIQLAFSVDSTGLNGARQFSTSAIVGTQLLQALDIAIDTPQTLWYTATVSSGAGSYAAYISEYEF